MTRDWIAGFFYLLLLLVLFAPFKFRHGIYEFFKTATDNRNLRFLCRVQ